VKPYEIKETIIGMPPGIGDLHWIMAKLESFKEKNNIERVKVHMNLGKQENKNFHDCSLEFLELIPFIDSAESVLEEIPFEYALVGGSGTPLFINHGGCDYMLEFNSYLEKGIRLKDILPEYEVNFDYPILEPRDAKMFANEAKKNAGGKLALVFTASEEANDNWVKDFWTPGDWMEVARRIHKETKCRPVLIGARWDKSYTDRIIKLDREGIIYDLVGKTSVTNLLALIREASVLIAFQCGVVMMATKFRTPVAGFWPVKSRANPKGLFKRSFTRSWLPPWADDVGFKPFGWGDENATPEGVFEAIKGYL